MINSTMEATLTAQVVDRYKAGVVGMSSKRCSDGHQGGSHGRQKQCAHPACSGHG